MRDEENPAKEVKRTTRVGKNAGAGRESASNEELGGEEARPAAPQFYPLPNTPETQQAIKQLGWAPANGLFTELARRVGPILAEILFKLLMEKAQIQPPGQAALLSGDTLRLWAADVLEANKETVLGLLNDQAEVILDSIIAAMRAGA